MSARQATLLEAAFAERVFHRPLHQSRVASFRRKQSSWPAYVEAFRRGNNVSDGVQVTRELNARSIAVTIDNLGENVTNAEEAKQSSSSITR